MARDGVVSTPGAVRSIQSMVPQLATMTDPQPIVVPTTITGSQTETGQLVVMPGSSLTIENATVTFTVGAGGGAPEPGLYVMPGGTLNIIDSTISNDSVPAETDAQRIARPWRLLSAGTLTVTRSTLADLTDVTATVGAVTVTHSTVRDTYNDGIAVVGDESPILIQNNESPILIQDNTVAGNRFLGCTVAPCAGEQGGGIYLANTSGARVFGNIVRAYHGTAGIVSQATTDGSYHYADDALIEGNVVILDDAQNLATPRFGIYCDGGRPTITGDAVATSEIGIGTALDCGATIQRDTVTGTRWTNGDKQPLLGYLAANNTDPNRAYHLLPSFTHDWDQKMAEGLQNLGDGHPVYRDNNFTGTTYAAAAFDSNGKVDPSPAAQLDLEHNWFGYGIGGPADRVAGDGSTPATHSGHAGRIVGNVDYKNWLAIRDIEPVETYVFIATNHIRSSIWHWIPEAMVENVSKQTLRASLWMPDIDENTPVRTIPPNGRTFDDSLTTTLIPDAVAVVQGYLGSTPFAAASVENW